MAESASLVIRVAQEGVAHVNTALGRLTINARGAEQGSNRLAQAMARANREAFSLDSTSAKLDNTLRTLISGAMIKKVMDYSDSWTTLSNKLIVVKREHEDLATVQQAVFDVAQRTRTSLEVTASLYSRLAQAMKDTNASSNDVLRLTETLNKALVVSGATAQESSAALLQFSQAIASGVLRGDEFRSVAEQAPKITQILAQALNTNIGGLRELAYSGKLTADIVLEALSHAAEGIDEEFSKTLPTLSQQFQIAQNNITKFVGESNSARQGVQAFGSALVALSNNMDTVITIAGMLLLVMGAKSVNAFAARTVATIAASRADAEHAATMSRVNAVATSQLGITARVTAEAVKTTQAQLQLARAQYNVARGTQDEAAALQRLNAVMVTHRQNVLAATQANQALTTAINGVATTANRGAAALGILRGALSLVGGPLGLIMLTAGAVWSYVEASKAAEQETQQYADSLEGLIESLDKMSEAQLRATAAESQRKIPELLEALNKEETALADVRKQIQWNENLLQQHGATKQQIAKATERLTTLHQEEAIIVAKVERSNIALANAYDLIGLAITKADNKLLSFVTNLSTKGGFKIDLGMDKKILDLLDRKLSDVAIKTKENELTMKGSAKEGYAYGKVMTDLGQHAQDYSDVVQGVIFGTMSLADAEKKSNKAFVEKIQALNAAHQKNYELTEGVKSGKRATAEATKEQKQSERVLEQYRNKLEETKIGLEENAKQRAILTAVHKMGTNALPEEIDEIKRLAAAVYDLDQKQKEVAKRPANREKVAAIDLKTYEYYEKIAMESKAKIAEINRLQEQDDLEHYQIYEDAKTRVLEAANIEREQLNKTLLNRMMSFNQSSMGVILDGLRQGVSEQNFFYKALFAAQQAMQIPSILANTETAATAALAWGTQQGGPAMGAMMAGVVKTLGYTSAATVAGLSLAGMAHDGIDNIPKEGTWLLQKGERVLNAPSNDKLNAFLDNPSNITGGSVTIHQYLTVTGKPDEGTLAYIKVAMEKAVMEGGQAGYDKVVNDLSTNGTARHLIMKT